MAVTRTFDAPPEAVFAVLADGWRYVEWVVGSQRIREVDDGWPAPGTRFHHSFGVGPLHIDDRTVCEVWEPPERCVLQVRAWPAGQAQVALTVRPVGAGSEVAIAEVPTHGWAKSLDGPPLRWATDLRNVESLRRLERAARRTGSSRP